MAILYPAYLSIFNPVAPAWSTGHPWNAAFRFSLLNLRQSVGLSGQEISLSQGRYLHSNTSMPSVGFESTIPVLERAKTYHVLDRAANVIGIIPRTNSKTLFCNNIYSIPNVWNKMDVQFISTQNSPYPRKKHIWRLVKIYCATLKINVKENSGNIGSVFLIIPY
jgi:hypothetical protein